MIWGAAGLTAIDVGFAESIVYEGGGAPEPIPLRVPWSDLPGSPFQGAGATERKVSCELGYADLPQRPDRSSRITRCGSVWRVIDVTDRDDIGKWVVALELVGAAS